MHLFLKVNKFHILNKQKFLEFRESAQINFNIPGENSAVSLKVFNLDLELSVIHGDVLTLDMQMATI